ncbi:MAG: M23 family metallopeptidase [Clostridiales bacterium]|nr:M23 family metallopeptidase [Clostridiales bacterium]
MNNKTIILKFVTSLLITTAIFGVSFTYADSVNANYLVNNIEKFSSVNIQKYGIFINENPIGYTETKEEAQDILARLKTMYLDGNTEILNVSFKEDVSISKDPIRVVDQDMVYAEDELMEYILKGTNERKIHEVESGENFWVISEMYGISVDNLLAANPAVVPERLQIGQEISLIVPKPLITVITVEEATYSKNIDYEVVYEDSASYYKGDQRTKINGVYGELEIVADVYKENGIESKREILSETVIKEPKTKVVYRGTKDPPPKIGTGTFSYPFDTNRGTVTSDFGMRYHPIYHDYRRHTGIDIALPMGTPIYAADGGKVISVGYSSGYGTMIKIDHGANMETVYAHLSKTYVKVGDKVFKGEKIGLSGNSGTSTGPHLHFEVRKLGVPVDPKNYLKFAF